MCTLSAAAEVYEEAAGHLCNTGVVKLLDFELGILGLVGTRWVLGRWGDQDNRPGLSWRGSLS